MTLAILHTESSCGWGGQELRIIDESVGMQKRGHQVTIAAPAESRIFAEAQGRAVHAIPLGITRKSFGGFRAMRGLLGAQHFDVVNTHSSTDSWLAALAAASLADRKSTRLNSSHMSESRMPSSA